MRQHRLTPGIILILLLAGLLGACGAGNRVSELEGQLNTLTADLEAAQTSLAAAEERVTELEAEVEAAAEAVTDAASASADEAMSSLQSELDAALEAQAEFEESLEASEAELAAVQEELEQSQADLEAAQEQIDELEASAEADAVSAQDSESDAVTEDTNDEDATDSDTGDESSSGEENGAADAIGAAAAGAAAAVADAVSNATDAVTDAAENAVDTVSDAASNASETVTDAVTDASETVTDAASDAADAVAETSERVSDAVTEVLAENAGGTVTVAITAEPPGWDPSASTSQEIARVMYHNVFEGLVRFNEQGEIVPALAESWAASEDGLAWTFTLREGVKFHDDTDLSTDDVIAKFERATDPDSGHTNPAYYEAIESVTADGQDITFTLSEPSSSLLYNLARPDSIIYPAAKADTQTSEPVGTGPFVFADYIEGSEVRLERFADYYRPGVPLLDEVVFRIIEDPNTRFAALQAGDIDLIGTSLAPEQFQQLEELDGVKGAAGAATTEITLALNNTNEALSDPRVRQAITHAIDKQAIVDGAMFGLGTVIGSHMSPSEPYYIDLSETYPFDPERARELLAEAGYEDGLELRFELPEPYNIERRSGQVIAQQLEEVGIEVDLSVVEWATWIERIFLGGDYDMTIIGHSEPRDINVYGNPDYYYKYDNPEIGELLTRIEQTSIEAEQTELFQQIATIIAEDAVNVWVFSPPYLVAARDDLEGFWTNQPTPSIDMTEVYRTN